MNLPGRAPGLAILFTIVAVGMGMPAFYRWKFVDLGRERDEILANAPSEAEARVALWFEHLQPQVVHVLGACRFSAQFPYLVSHVMAPRSGDEPPEVWGVPDAEITVDSVVLDGLAVRVILPAPRVVVRDVLVGDNANGVGVSPPGAPPRDPRVLLRNRIEFILRKHMSALEMDIPGAYLSVEVGGLVRPRAAQAATDQASTGAD